MSLCGAKWSTIVTDPTSQSVVPFSRRRNTCMSAFDELRISGGNGNFKPMPVQLPVKAVKEEWDNCELCAPLDKIEPGVICPGCQALIDEGLAEIVKIPAHLNETTWAEKTTSYNPAYTWWEPPAPMTGVVKASMPC